MYELCTCTVVFYLPSFIRKGSIDLNLLFPSICLVNHSLSVILPAQNESTSGNDTSALAPGVLRVHHFRCVCSLGIWYRHRGCIDTVCSSAYNNPIKISFHFSFLIAFSNCIFFFLVLYCAYYCSSSVASTRRVVTRLFSHFQSAISLDAFWSCFPLSFFFFFFVFSWIFSFPPPKARVIHFMHRFARRLAYT